MEKQVKKLFFLLGLLFAALANAQQQGNVEIFEDARIKQLVNKHQQINKAKETVNGFRVQIHFGAERDKAMEQKVKFLQLYPGIETYETYQQPNFKIRVGDFRTRIEAQKFTKEINANFPSAFIVSDEIKIPTLE